MNVSGTLNALKLLYSPTSFLPHLTISNFNNLPIPLSIKSYNPANPNDPITTRIKVIVLDKDNCFASPHSNDVYPDYKSTWSKLLQAYPSSLRPEEKCQLLIVSNTSGSLSKDPDLKLAKALEENTKVKVFVHKQPKPGCHKELLDYLMKPSKIYSSDGKTVLKEISPVVQHPSEIAIVGDRLLTDVALANNMGAHAVYIKDGIVPNTSIFTRFERLFEEKMTEWGFKPPVPKFK